MPFSGTRDGTAVGLVARATLLALQRMGIKTSTRKVPYSRLYKWIHSGQLDVAVSVLKSPERAKQAHYSAPMAVEYTIVLVRKGDTFPFDQPDDLRNHRIGAQLGFLYPGIDHMNLPLVRERDYFTSIPKLVDGRFDGTLVGSVTGLYDAQKLGLLDRVEALPNASEVIPLGAAFSVNAFQSEDVMAFDDLISNLQKGAEWRRLIDESGAAPHLRDWPLIRQQR